MTTFSGQRAQVLDLARRSARLAHDRCEAPLAEALEQAAEALAEGRLTVAAVGEFKRGKSTLLNALIEEPDLFPPNASVATNLVTSVTHGDAERVTVHLEGDASGDSPRDEEITRAQIRDFVTEQGNPHNRRRARLVEIELPNEKLRDGLLFVDTPGVGGLNTEHTAITYGFVTNADVVLFVLDALTPLSTKELEFVELVHEHSHAVLFVVTKCEKERDYQAIVRNTRDKLAATLERPGESFRIIPVGSMAKLEYLRSGDEEDLEVSNFGELENEVWEVLGARRGAILLLRALGIVARALDRMIEPLQTELDAYGRQTEAELEATERRIAEQSTRAEALRRGQAAWRKTLQRKLQLAGQRFDELARTQGRTLRHKLDALLDDQRMLDRPQDIISVVERDLTLIATDLQKALSATSDEVCQALAAETELELNPAAPDVPIAATASAPDLDAIQEPGNPKGARFLERMWKARMGAGMGGLIGSLIGTVVVPGVGTALGGALGGVLGGATSARDHARQTKERDRQKLRALLSKRLSPWLEDALAELNATRREALTLTQHAIADAFDDMLRAEQDRLASAAAALSAARERGADERAARIAEIRGPLDALRALRLEADAQAQAALGTGRHTDGTSGRAQAGEESTGEAAGDAPAREAVTSHVPVADVGGPAAE